MTDLFYQADDNRQAGDYNYPSETFSEELARFFAAQTITPLQRFFARCKYWSSGAFLVLATILFFYGLWGVGIRDYALPAIFERESTSVQTGEERVVPASPFVAENEITPFEAAQEASMERTRIALSIIFWSWVSLTAIFFCLLIINRRVVKNWLDSV